MISAYIIIFSRFFLFKILFCFILNYSATTLEVCYSPLVFEVFAMLPDLHLCFSVLEK